MNLLEQYLEVFKNGQSVYVQGKGIVSKVEDLPKEIQMLKVNEVFIPELESPKVKKLEITKNLEVLDEKGRVEKEVPVNKEKTSYEKPLEKVKPESRENK